MAVDRFATPLYSVSEASRYLGVSDSTFRAWATGYTRRSPDRADVRGEPIVTTISGQPASDGFAELRHLPGYERARVVADPRHGFGQPTFVAGGARVADALGLFWAGESLATVSAEYGVPEDELADAVRVASRLVAA